MVRFCTPFFNVGKICQRKDPTQKTGLVMLGTVERCQKKCCVAVVSECPYAPLPSAEYQRSVSNSIRTGPWINVRRWLGVISHHVGGQVCVRGSPGGREGTRIYYRKKASQRMRSDALGITPSEPHRESELFWRHEGWTFRTPGR